jgi:hypothetical protein
MTRALTNFAVFVIGCSVIGCTSQSNREAIEGYQASENHKQEAFDNALRIADEQMLYSTLQFARKYSGDPATIEEGIKAAWQAKTVLEETRYQYALGRMWSLVTVGNYVYDQQGWVNVLFEDKAKDLKKFVQAEREGDKAAAEAPPATAPSVLDGLLKELEAK